jgi:hypothetical protein
MRTNEKEIIQGLINSAQDFRFCVPRTIQTNKRPLHPGIVIW